MIADLLRHLPGHLPGRGAADLPAPDAYAAELYARGYVCGAEPPRAPEGWLRLRFGRHHLAHDPRLAATRATAGPGNGEADGAAELLCLGLICDVRRPEATAAEVVAGLARGLAAAEADFFEDLAHACGRHVVLFRRGGSPNGGADGSWGPSWLVTDATGMKPAFRTLGAPRLVASHAGLAAEAAGRGRAPDLAFRKGYPGLRTPFEDVLLLTPNTRLNLDDGTVERFWPARAIAPLTSDAAAALAGGWMQAAFDHLAARHAPVVSVTGGLDSRVTLAMTRRHPDIPLFTYFRRAGLETDAADRAFAAAFGRATGRAVRVFTLSEGAPTDPGFLRLLERNTYFDHIRRAAWTYHQAFAALPGAVHLRSNLAEIGREFWKHKRFPVATPVDLARIYLAERSEYPAGYVFAVIERFAELDAVTGLLAAGDHVDVKSLLYWEHRMAAWHSQVTAEGDPAFDTVSLYNCRRLLETLLAVPRPDRLRGVVPRRIIAARWPELTRFPVNGKPFNA